MAAVVAVDEEADIVEGVAAVSDTFVSGTEQAAEDGGDAEADEEEAWDGGAASYQSATSSPGVEGAGCCSSQSCFASLQARFSCLRARIAEASGVTEEPAANAC